jgi:hypothetical protein
MSVKIDNLNNLTSQSSVSVPTENSVRSFDSSEDAGYFFAIESQIQTFLEFVSFCQTYENKDTPAQIYSVKIRDILGRDYRKTLKALTDSGVLTINHSYLPTVEAKASGQTAFCKRYYVHKSDNTITIEKIVDTIKTFAGSKFRTRCKDIGVVTITNELNNVINKLILQHKDLLITDITDYLKSIDSVKALRVCYSLNQLFAPRELKLNDKDNRVFNPWAALPNEVKNIIKKYSDTATIDIVNCHPTFLAKHLNCSKSVCKQWEAYWNNSYNREALAEELGVTTDRIKKMLIAYINGATTHEHNNRRISLKPLQNALLVKFPEVMKEFSKLSIEERKTIGTAISKNYEQPLITNTNLLNYIQSQQCVPAYEYDGFTVINLGNKQSFADRVNRIEKYLIALCREMLGVTIAVKTQITYTEVEDNNALSAMDFINESLLNSNGYKSLLVRIADLKKNKQQSWQRYYSTKKQNYYEKWQALKSEYDVLVAQADNYLNS